MNKLIPTLLTIVFATAPSLANSQMRQGTLYPDVPRLLSRFETEGPKILQGLVKLANEECSRFGMEKLSLDQAIAKAAHLPTTIQGTCLLPNLVSEQDKLRSIFQNAARSPMQFPGVFTPSDLKDGWWQIPFFSENELDPAQLLLSWILVDEGIRRALKEFGPYVKTPESTFASIFLPLVLAYENGGSRSLQIKTFLENSQCGDNQIPCIVENAEMVAAFNKAIAEQQERITSDMQVLRKPIDATVNDDVMNVTQALQARDAIEQLRGQKGSALEWLSAMNQHGLFAPEVRKYRDSLYDLGKVQKDLSNELLGQALAAGLELAELSKLQKWTSERLTLPSFQYSEKNLVIDSPAITQLVRADLSNILSNVEALILVRANELTGVEQ